MAFSLINPNDNILVVGDGNFSYSYDVANYIKEQNGKGHIFTTSLDSIEVLKKKYTNAVTYIDKLKELNHTVVHHIDATNLRNTLANSNFNQNSKLYDKIIFNFPLSPLTKTLDDVKNSPSPDVNIRNRYLIWQFLREAATLLTKSAKSAVLITSKTCKPYDRWRIESLGSNCTQKIPFNISKFNHYTARKVNVVENQKRKRRKIDFSINDAITFVFQPHIVLSRSNSNSDCGKKNAVCPTATTSSTTTTTTASSDNVIKSNRKFFCNLCSIYTKTQFSLDEHFVGRRHKIFMGTERKWKLFLTNLKANNDKLPTYQYFSK